MRRIRRALKEHIVNKAGQVLRRLTVLADDDHQLSHKPFRQRKPGQAALAPVECQRSNGHKTHTHPEKVLNRVSFIQNSGSETAMNARIA